MLQISGSFDLKHVQLGRVAIANFDEQSGNLSFNLLDDPDTGDYVLYDILQVEVADPSLTTKLNYTVSWMGDNNIIMSGYMSDVGLPNVPGPIPLCAINQGTILTDNTIPNVADLDGNSIMTPPTVIHAVKGTPILVSITIIGATTLKYSYHATLFRLQ